MLLGEAAKPTTVSAYTTLLQPYLPPVDTVDAIWRTKSGISGTFSVSFGTTVSDSEYSVACEKGSVTVVGSTVTVRQGQEGEGSSTEKDFSSQGSGVKQEVAAWAESLVSGQANPRQAPEEALADLEILEKMLRSGEAQGKGENLCYQI
jgi:predicted dehydrogenase